MDVLMIYCLAIAISGARKIPWFLKALLIQFLLVSLVYFIFVLKFYGGIYKTSAEGKRRTRKSIRNKQLTAFADSCPIQSIRFADFSFFEPTTGLILTEFVVEQAATMILLTRNYFVK